ncbi:BREX system Lon protease-like protein BrxL [Gulosibacter sp. GYB002]|uniref:BREX system Lon protease-like protein BrxL n=1 Tax=Gulosibacter sp. GYB002 TaxID=2994391 RepID=UPI002F9629DA
MTDTGNHPNDESDIATSTPSQNDLDYKINLLFGGSVVRKDLVKVVKGNAIVPSYVLEYLLGQYAASDDEETIQAGIDAVRRILADHYVHRNEAELVKSTIREKGRHRIIDKVTVTLNDKQDVYQASFANLGLSGVIIEPAIVNANPKLLVGGVWCICDIEYFHSDDVRVVPWILGSLKPIQMSNFDLDGYLESRRGFNTEEWIDLLIQSIGFNPKMFGRRAKLLQLVRLIPFVERNYNLIELGPKGTGKSHIYSEFSPHGMLISGGEVTVPKLFVNNANGRIGLVGYWDVVAFDEFAGKKKRTDKALVDIMKNYMANKSFSRGVETLGAEASMVFVGNTSHNVPYMLKHSDLFDELPEAYHDSAYLDRLHFYIPGWEVDTIRSEMFATGYGFVVDYIAEVLRSMRNTDFSDRYQQHFTLGSNISTRDRDGIQKTFSGLMKLIFPTGQATNAEIEELLRFAIEGRKRVKDQILRIDTTMAAVDFGYSDKTGVWHGVSTLEEDEYPDYYQSRSFNADDEAPTAATDTPDHDLEKAAQTSDTLQPHLFEGHREFQENQRGVSYETLLLPHLRGAKEISIVDPYIRLPHQGRNLVDLLSLLAASKDPADEIMVTLVTKAEQGEYEQQHLHMLKEIQDSAATVGIRFAVTWDETIHDRSIRTDHGWKLLLGRGLDIFQKGSGSQYDLGARRQEFRQVFAFGITYIRENGPDAEAA